MIYSVKFYQKVSYHSHDNETLITKSFFVYKFSLPTNTTSFNGNALNEFYEEIDA